MYADVGGEAQRGREIERRGLSPWQSQGTNDPQCLARSLCRDARHRHTNDFIGNTANSNSLDRVHALNVLLLGNEEK